MIENTLTKIIRPESNIEKKFYRNLKKINRLSHKYPVFMGIDFEFNTKKLALMQILFQIHKKSKVINKYYILYPPELSQKTNNYMRDNILRNSQILKILHGAESLDIPCIISDMFNYDFDGLIDFFLSMVDTRYMCEYLNITNSEPNICKIYDTLLKYNIIDIQTKDDLDQNEQKMGPIYNIIIDINTLTPELIRYAIHDVVYLSELFNKMKLLIIKSNPKNYYILLDAIRYSYMEKKNITNIGDDIIVCNMMNNYFVYINGKQVLLLKIFNMVYDDYIESFDNLKPIYQINYLKLNLVNLLKFVVYKQILNVHTVYSNRTTKVDYKFDDKYKIILNDIQIVDLNYLHSMIVDFDKYVKIKIV
jgi:hypothetical protein